MSYKVCCITKKFEDNVRDVYVGLTTEYVKNYLNNIICQSRQLPYTKLLRRIREVGTSRWKIDCLWIGFSKEKAYEMEKKFCQELRPDLTHWECPDYDGNFEKPKPKVKRTEQENREAILLYNKKYYQENREAKKKYYQDNREKILAQAKIYREKHREEISLYHKKYYQENREALLLYHKKYKQENREAISLYNKKYKQENREAISLYNKNTRRVKKQR